MINDIYYNPTKILFGRGMEEKVGEETAKHANKVLIVYGSERIKKNGLFDKVTASLKSAGVAYEALGGVKSNPRSGLVYQGIEICRKEGISFLLAIGGGSVIDTAKAIGYGVPYAGDFMDLYLGKAEPESCLGIGTILTIPGAGSESSNGSVITDEKLGLKRSCDTDLARPVFSIMNPELTYTAPLYHTLAGAFDGISHAMERYFTDTTFVEVSDGMAEGIMKALMKYMKRVIKEPDNYDVRAELMWGCKVAQDGCIGVGREQAWSSHLLQRDIGSIAFESSHGAGLAVITPKWMRYVYKHNIPRFVRFANRVMDVPVNPWDEEETVLEGIKRLELFIKEIGLPTTLREVGVNSRKDILVMADKAYPDENGTLGGFYPLKKQDFINILNEAF